jgi:hypothetical protein
MNDHLLRNVELLATQGGDIRLLNTYRGIPVIHRAAILFDKRGTVAVEIHPHQAVCMKLDGKTFVVTENGSDPLLARVRKVEMLSREAILSDFQHAGTVFSKRFAVRVQPSAPIALSLDDGVNRAAAQLVDISSSGMGVSGLNAALLGHENLQVGQVVHVEFNLPICEEKLHLKGRITCCTPSHAGLLLRVGMATHPDPPARDRLQEYITLRQAEILDELEHMYETLCRQQGAGL